MAEDIEECHMRLGEELVTLRCVPIEEAERTKKALGTGESIVFKMQKEEHAYRRGRIRILDNFWEVKRRKIPREIPIKWQNLKYFGFLENRIAEINFFNKSHLGGC